MNLLYIKIFTLFVMSGFTLAAQNYKVNISIAGQPANPVVFGKVKGDKFIPADTLETVTADFNPFGNNEKSVTGNPLYARQSVKSVTFTFPEDAFPSMYRLVFGYTTYARVMGEGPQQLDFIFNNENIILKTDFNYPSDSVKVIESEENKVWFAFLSEEREYQRRIKELEDEVNYYRSVQMSLSEADAEGRDGKDLTGAIKSSRRLEDIQSELTESANRFNQVQLERDLYIKQLAGENEYLLASKFILQFREPFRDGYLTSDDRQKSYQQEFLGYLDFSDENLINSSILSDKIFKYLVTFNRSEYDHVQREQAYIEAVDNLMAQVLDSGGEESTDFPADDNREGQPAGKMPKNFAVYEFVLNYLVHGFEVLRMDKVLTHISENYSEMLCSTDEKTTLIRKLESQKMVKGTVVADFTMDDINSDPVTISHILKELNLIIFWASWCPHCNEILPSIKTWYNSIKNPELEIIAISLDSSRSEWQKATYSGGFEQFYNLSDLKEWDGQVTEEYNVYATPTMFLVDRNRKIVAKPLTLRELMQTVD
jgi:thiol-disulfide isomerase/thioredoxin